LNVGNNLSVGFNGSGTLQINGGFVSSDGGMMGTNASAVGNVSVTSGSWDVSSSLTVGFFGSGTLQINGGSVSSSGGNIGNQIGGVGTANTSSGTWSMSEDLVVGSSGTGSLNINGGLVSVSNGITMANSAGSRGTITLASGTLYTARIRETGGTGTINLNGGILQARANDSDYLSGFEAGDVTINSGGAFIDTNGFAIGINTVLSGSGALTKTGARTLTLSGSNTYSGGTIINSGTLSVGNNNAVGTGEVTVNAGTFLIQSGFSATNQITLAGGTLARVFSASASLANAINATSEFAGGRADTTGAILAGTTSAVATISATFAATSLASNDVIRLSDVYGLSGVPIINVGTGETDMFVLQLQVVDVSASSFLAWLNPNTNQWVNAVSGNIGGVAAFQGDGAYNPGTDFVLGYYGVDTVNDTVWAVINHNSDFSVVPEPSTFALFALGASLFLRRRKTRG
jgi:autotransporter-associated beta strand protein/T5SS/PEP-CTERM-associated repeat protein